MWKLIALAAAVLGASVPADAQDGSEVLAERTPEGAVAFLDQFLRDMGARGRFLLYFPNRWGRSDRRRFQDWRLAVDGEPESTNKGMASAAIVALVAQAPCQTDFTLTDLHYAGTTGGSVDPYDLLISAPGQSAIYRMDWSQVSVVRVTPIRSNLVSAQGYPLNFYTMRGGFGEFYFRTLEEANRAAFAMDFLRAACVPRSTTGF